MNFDFSFPCPYLSKAQLSFATISCRLTNALRTKAAWCFGSTSLDSHLLLSFGLLILYILSSLIFLIVFLKIVFSGRVASNCLGCSYKTWRSQDPNALHLPFLIVLRCCHSFLCHMENWQLKEPVFHGCIHVGVFKSKKTFPDVLWETSLCIKGHNFTTNS